MLTNVLLVLVIVLLLGFCGLAFIAVRGLQRLGGFLPPSNAKLATPPDLAASGYTTLEDEDDDVSDGAISGVPTRTCGSCEHFDQAGGQKIITMHPAFAEAAKIIPPWRMGRALKLKPNPEYLALSAEINATIDQQRAKELTKRLETLPPEIPLTPEEQVEPKVLHVEWSDFGACMHHQELRAKSDTCDRFVPRGLLPASALLRASKSEATS